MSEVTIVICYKKGTLDMLRVCLDSIKRHTKYPHKIVILTLRCEEELFDWGYEIQLIEKPKDDVSVNKLHGYVLDKYIPRKIETEWFLTLDSDCFPVAGGWLTELMEMNPICGGVLHPWSPSERTDSYYAMSLEGRIRSQHCWLSTHVACQLMKTKTFRTLAATFSGGDDTGLLIPKEVREMGLDCEGWKPTCTPQMENAEFNRYVCLVYGDKIYHQGGFTRVACGDKPVFEDIEKEIWERIKKENGAEWILKEGYRFKFDQEDEVFKKKMARLFGYKVETHDGHDSYLLP